MEVDFTVAVFYIGFGAFWPGVPARDMTADEWAALTEDTRARVLEMNLYQVVDGGADDGQGVLAEDAGRVDAGSTDGGVGAVPVRRRGRASVRGSVAAGGDTESAGGGEEAGAGHA